MNSIPIWRQIQKQNFTRLDLLADFLELSDDLRKQLLKRPAFPLNLPRRLAQKITKQSLDDPILRQFVPLIEETITSPTFSFDPVNDLSFRRCTNLLQKYHGRVLIIASMACAMHCRYCFRKNFPHENASSGFSLEIEQIRKDPSIQEVILSGGDPLALSNETLRSLLSQLEKIPHVRRIRFHTRFPIGIPERIDPAFLSILSTHSQQIIFVFHINHPKELDQDVVNAAKSIQRLGISTLCQSVLLKGVNDEEETLLSLVQCLTNAGILPYYLHLLDRVDGCAHFEVSKERGLQLIAYLQSHSSGYCVPRLVQEIPGEKSKTAVT